MQTSFTKRQLADPAVAEADGILKTCVHYGFCTATCPTYVLFRDENDSPRGRIDLIRAMLEKGGAPDPKTVHHLDRCLSCLSCVTTCAVKVDYMHLIDIARAHIEQHFRRPLASGCCGPLLARTLPYPRRFAAALALGGWRSRCATVGCRGASAALLELLPSASFAREARRIAAPRFIRRRARAACAWCCWPAARSRPWTPRSMPRRSGC